MLCVCSSPVFPCCAVLTFSTRGIASCQLWATRAFRLSLTAGVTMVISQCDWHVSFILSLREIKQDFACPAPPPSPIFLVLNVHHCKEGCLGVPWHSEETVGVSQAQKVWEPLYYTVLKTVPDKEYLEHASEISILNHWQVSTMILGAKQCFFIHAGLWFSLNISKNYFQSMKCKWDYWCK